MDIVFLDLPAVPAEIQSTLIDCVENMPGDQDSVKWMNDFHNQQINSAEMIYGNKHTILDDKLIESIAKIYRSDLGDVLPIVGRIRTVNQEPATIPPHCDRGRHVALNYILTKGGDFVETVLYQEHRPTTSLDTSQNCRFDQVSCGKYYNLPLHQWHAFNAQRYHSVRNITGTRIILSLVLLEKSTWDEFCEHYSHLFLQQTVDIVS